MAASKIGTVYVTYDLPTVTDFAGVSVWASIQENFTPASANIVVDRTTNRSISFEMPQQILYVRVAALDLWGDDHYVSPQFVLDPLHMFDRLAQQITESHLHQSLLAPIQMIDGSGGLAEQALDNAADIIVEANARLALAQQLRGSYTGNDLSQVQTGLLKDERIAREQGLTQLASQMALLTAGNANQFDHVEIWYFDSGVEGWTSNGGSPTTPSAGWLRPFFGADTTAISPTISVDGTKYTQVRARIRKVGNPTWDGSIYYRTPDTPAFTADRKVNIPRPNYETGGVALLTWQMDSALNWVGSTIVRIRADIGQVTTETDYFEIDWIAIGRPAPGASSAELFTEQQARAEADSAMATEIAIANANISGKANQSALTALTSTVTNQGNTLTAQGNNLAVLESLLKISVLNANPSFANWTGTMPDGYSSWQSVVGFTKYTGPYAYSGGHAISYTNTGTEEKGFSFIINGIDNPEFVDVEIVFTLVSGSLDGCGVQFGWISSTPANYWRHTAFKNLFTATDIYNKKTVAKFRLTRPSNFSGTLTELFVYVFANRNDVPNYGPLANKTIIFDRVAVTKSDVSAKVLQTIESRVTQTENTITSQSNQLTQLNNEIAGKASSSALSALQNTVTQQGGLVTAQGQQITQISSSLPGGGNLIPTDSEFGLPGLNGWSGWSQVGAPFIADRNLAGSSWTPEGANQIGIVSDGQPDGVFHLYMANIAVTGGKHYCFSAFTASHRSTNQLLIEWYPSIGAAMLSQSSSASSSAGGGISLTAWNRSFVIAQAPANARVATIVYRMSRSANQLGPYAWMCKPMFCEVPAVTQTPPLYSPSNSSKTIAQVQVLAEAAVNNANNAVARWEVKTNVNNLQGGVGFYNDGVKTRFAIHADQFSVYSPGSQSFSLIVEGGKVLVSDQSIKNLSVDKLIGNTANFVKLNVGTLIVDDIQGNVSDVYVSGPHTHAFNFGGTSGGYGETGAQVAVAYITVPARANNRPYGTQYSVQGVATKSTAGHANIVADFFEPNPNASYSYLVGNWNDYQIGSNHIQRAITYPNGTSPTSPPNFNNIQVGDVVTMYSDINNFMEGVVTVIHGINSSAGPNSYVSGRALILEQIVRLGSIPSNGAGCEFSVRTPAGRVYRRLGITLAQSVYTQVANETIRFNMTHFDTTGKTTSGRTILCTIGHRGAGNCHNQLLNFAVLAGR